MSKAKSSAGADKKVTWQGFVNVYLNRQEKEHIKKNVLSDSAAVEFISEAAENGYKFSVSYAAKAGYYTATLYGNTAGGANAGWAMSLRHADFLTALSALHHVVSQDGWKGDWAERFTTVDDTDW